MFTALVPAAMAQAPGKMGIISDPGFARFNVLKGETDNRTVKVYSDESAPFTATKVVSPVPWLVASMRSATAEERVASANPNNPQYLIEIKLDGTAPVGVIAQKVKVLTDSAVRPEVVINVTGVVRPPYRVDPQAINFGEVAPSDTAATRTVGIRSNNLKQPGGFAITKIENPGSAFVDVTFKPTTNAGEYIVTFQIRKDAGPQSFNNVIVRIHTNSPVAPVVDIPLKGVIKAMH
jgi:hypothetical protein